MEGARNPIADELAQDAEDHAWNDWGDEFSKRQRKHFGSPFWRLKCDNCGGTTFQVFVTDSYEASARCECGMWFVVHSG